MTDAEIDPVLLTAVVTVVLFGLGHGVGMLIVAVLIIIPAAIMAVGLLVMCWGRIVGVGPVLWIGLIFLLATAAASFSGQ